MNLTTLFNFALEHQGHVFLLVLTGVVYLSKINTNTKLTQQSVKNIHKDMARHEKRLNAHGERLDDHEGRIIKAETKICLINQNRCEGEQ